VEKKLDPPYIPDPKTRDEENKLTPHKELVEANDN
jgi:hypothetical protein